MLLLYVYKCFVKSVNNHRILKLSYMLKLQLCMILYGLVYDFLHEVNTDSTYTIELKHIAYRR